MTILRKLRAILTLGIVSGAFCWLAMALGRSGYELIAYGHLGFGSRMAWQVGLLGFVGGCLYATAVALLPPRDPSRGLTAGRSALYGALGGAIVLLGLRFLVLGDRISGGLVGSVLVPLAACALVGAGMGLAITGTAKRSALPPGEEEARLLR